MDLRNVLLVILVLMGTHANRSGEFTRLCLAIQSCLAAQISKSLNADVYIFDSVGKFDNATLHIVDNIRVQKVDDLVAVLSLTGQKVFKSANEYEQFIPPELISEGTVVLDQVGWRLTLTATRNNPNFICALSDCPKHCSRQR